MTRRYDFDQLLRLRDSPLCVRPKDLPPIEEWMGQPVEDKSKRTQASTRGQRDTPSFASGLTSGKPTSLDLNRHGRQTSNGDFAGRSMFSPGLRDTEKQLDSSARNAFGSLSPRGDQPIGMGRFGLTDRDQPSARASNRFSNLRSSKDEGDSWSTGKSTTRRPDGEEGERAFSRRHDREHNGNGTREHHRRYGSETANEGIRSKDWRSGDKNSSRISRDWNNAQEQDPEWMIEEKPEQEPKKYTADDFEAWKKSMKAQAAAKTDGAASAALVEQKPSSTGLVPKKALETPLVLDSAEDKFFGLWAPEPAQKTEIISPGISSVTNGGPKTSKSSKFTGFFAVEPTPTSTAPTATSPPPAANAISRSPAAEDQQGIERILNMLKNKPNANAAAAAILGGPKQRTPPPPEATSTSATPPLVSPRPKSHGVQNFLNPQSPAPDANSQFLLNLMRSKDSDPPQQNQFSLQSQQSRSGPTGNINSQHSHHGSHSLPGPQNVQGVQHQQNAHYLPQFDRGADMHHSQEFPPIFDKLNPSNHMQQPGRHGRVDSRNFNEPQLPPHHQHGPPPPGFPPGFPPNHSGPNFPPGLGPPPPQHEHGPGFQGMRQGPGMPPGFGEPGPFRNGMNYPPGFGLPQHLAGMNINDGPGPGPGPGPGSGPGLGMPPGFGGPGVPGGPLGPRGPGGPAGFGRPPPGFGGRGGPMGMTAEHYNSDRREEPGMYGPRD